MRKPHQTGLSGKAGSRGREQVGAQLDRPHLTRFEMSRAQSVGQAGIPRQALQHGRSTGLESLWKEEGAHSHSPCMSEGAAAADLPALPSHGEKEGKPQVRHRNVTCPHNLHFVPHSMTSQLLDSALRVVIASP